jgi:hypothetical protein
MRFRITLPDPFVGAWIDYIRFILKAPMIGWREAARGIKRFRRFVPIVGTAPSAREYGRVLRSAWLLVMASRIEGGASIEAYFQQLYGEVRRIMQRGGENLSQLFMAVVFTGLVLGLFSAVLPSMPGMGMLVLGAMGVAVMLLSPKAHYITITELDLIGVALAVASYVIAGFVLNHPNLAVSTALLAYGLVVLPSTIRDYKLRQSMRMRVMNSFNEITTKPIPTPLRDLSPIEKALKPLWEEARGSGAPYLVAWSNTLVTEFLGVVDNILTNGFLYGLIVLGMGAGVSVGMFTWILGLIWKSLQYSVQAGVSIPFIGGMGVNNYYNTIGTGILGGTMMFDYRLGLLVGGLLGVVGWFLLHPYFTLY